MLENIYDFLYGTHVQSFITITPIDKIDNDKIDNDNISNRYTTDIMSLSAQKDMCYIFYIDELYKMNNFNRIEKTDLLYLTLPLMTLDTLKKLSSIQIEYYNVIDINKFHREIMNTDLRLLAFSDDFVENSLILKYVIKSKLNDFI